MKYYKVIINFAIITLKVFSEFILRSIWNSCKCISQFYIKSIKPWAPVRTQTLELTQMFDLAGGLTAAAGKSNWF